jgi:hypothetical protein
MAYNGSCSENQKGTNVKQVCVEWGNIARIWRAVPGFKFDSEADAQNLTKVQEAIQNEQLYPFPLLSGFEVNDEDTIYDEQALGKAYVRAGKKDWKLQMFSNPYKDAQLRTHSLAAGGFYQVDSLGGFRGIQNEAGELYPIPYQIFAVEKAIENNGSDASFKFVISIGLSDSQVNAYADDVAIVEGSDIAWNAITVEGLENVELTVASASATTIVVGATVEGTSVPVTGLDSTPSADFIVKTAAGVEIVPTLISEDGTTGVYTLTVTGLVTGDTIALTSPAVMITEGYKGDNPVSMTVV